MSDGKRYAHRSVWEDTYGPIPDGCVIKHICDNKLCVNITHLECGTQSENVKEAYDRGLKNPTRKLSKKQFKEVFDRSHKENNSKLAREFGISRQLVCDIKKGRSVWGM